MAAVEDGDPAIGVQENEQGRPETTLENETHDIPTATSIADAVPEPAAPSAPQQAASTQTDATPDHKVKRTIEYRQQTDGTLLYTRSIGGDIKAEQSHTGPVFEIIDVNYTAETKDTTKDTGITTKDGSSAPAPIVSYVSRQRIRIYSHAVISAIQAVVNYYPNCIVIGKRIELHEPYAVLVHHWDELKDHREKFNPSLLAQDAEPKDCLLTDTYEHLGYILDFLEDMWGEKIRKEKERWAKPVPTATYAMLWLLLKPGIDVYYDEDQDKTREPFVLSHVVADVYNNTIYNYDFALWYLGGSDHRYLLPEMIEAPIRPFDGEKEIQSLDIFPCEYFGGHKEHREELIKRGQRYLELREKKCMYYEGESNENPRREYRGYVMVDPAQYNVDEPGERTLRHVVDVKPSGAPSCFCRRCSDMETESKRSPKFEGYMYISHKKVKRMTDHQYFICGRDIPAFVFNIREWKYLFLSGFREPKWDLGLVDNLVLKPHYKKLILGISKTFMDQKHAMQKKPPTSASPPPSPVPSPPPTFQPWSADFIDNKGKGLIFLLHGKPGVGKTYTAECISEHIRRPLLPITCSDIGVDPMTVERNLIRWFKLAHNWNAVMLLDEADIYMEYRQIHDLTRNNLVASFLRAMEYYEGILFLTTNRVGTFDEAFLSRINLTIYYPEFSDEERETIWNNYFDKLEREAGETFYVSDSTKEYASGSEAVKQLKWNGREIRNAFQIAVNLAQAEGTKDKKGRFIVKRDHIKVTAELSKEFKNYMESVHQKNESQRAQIMGYRYDNYNLPSATKQEFI